jgi:hypothetical protein
MQTVFRLLVLGPAEGRIRVVLSLPKILNGFRGKCRLVLSVTAKDYAMFDLSSQDNSRLSAHANPAHLAGDLRAIDSSSRAKRSVVSTG